MVVRALCEGNSIRGTARLTGVAINTVAKLLRDLGSVCLDFQDEVMYDPIFGLNATELSQVLDDFPLLDRTQPSPYSGSSTVTRDLVLTRYGRMMGQIDATSERRLREASSAGAIPYIPGELAAELVVGARKMPVQ